MPRKYEHLARRGCRPWCCFNEAGADAPEIPSLSLPIARANSGFNEAGADAPEIRGAYARFDQTIQRFNEAGADAPEIHGTNVGPVPHVCASMRPGRMPRKYYCYTAARR